MRKMGGGGGGGNKNKKRVFGVEKSLKIVIKGGYQKNNNWLFVRLEHGMELD